jgi:hypothetical protein
MLNGYEIAMLLTIAASFVYMMVRLFRAFELEKKEKTEQIKHQQLDEKNE